MKMHVVMKERQSAIIRLRSRLNALKNSFATRTTMTDLSPQAQAVLDAAFPAYDDENLYFVTGEQHAGKIAAAALLAAADLLSAEVDAPEVDGSKYYGLWHSQALLIAIAAELAGTTTTPDES